MSDQPQEEKQEESPEGKPLINPTGQEEGPTRVEEGKEPLGGTIALTFANYQDFLNHSGRLGRSLSSASSGVTGIGRSLAEIGNIYRDKNFKNQVIAGYDSALQQKIRAHEKEINQLKSNINDLTEDLITRTEESKEKEEKIRVLESTIKELNGKESLSHLISRVNVSAQKKLLEDPEFRSLFEQQKPCPAYVLSIDIRRSTELMLKAREARLYAGFIIDLARRLREIILDNYGIFDKFTGDGILAFFPNFYSGTDAGFRAIAAAAECHKTFEDHYTAHRHCFISVLKDIGLGIGIDCGDIHMVQIGGEFTVVGTPVVYACRMGGAEARQTYLNHPAYEQIFDKYSAYCDFDLRDIDIKHEGLTLAYRARLNGKLFQAAIPDWDKSAGDNS